MITGWIGALTSCQEVQPAEEDQFIHRAAVFVNKNRIDEYRAYQIPWKRDFTKSNKSLNKGSAPFIYAMLEKLPPPEY